MMMWRPEIVSDARRSRGRWRRRRERGERQLAHRCAVLDAAQELVEVAAVIHERRDVGVWPSSSARSMQPAICSAITASISLGGDERFDPVLLVGDVACEMSGAAHARLRSPSDPDPRHRAKAAELAAELLVTS